MVLTSIQWVQRRPAADDIAIAHADFAARHWTPQLGKWGATTGYAHVGRFSCHASTMRTYPTPQLHGEMENPGYRVVLLISSRSPTLPILKKLRRSAISVSSHDLPAPPRTEEGARDFHKRGLPLLITCGAPHNVKIPNHFFILG